MCWDSTKLAKAKIMHQKLLELKSQVLTHSGIASTCSAHNHREWFNSMLLWGCYRVIESTHLKSYIYIDGNVSVCLYCVAKVCKQRFMWDKCHVSSVFLYFFLVHSGSFLGQRSQEPDPRPQWDRQPDLSSQRRAQTEDHLVRQWSPHREWVKWNREPKTEKFYISHKLTSEASDGNREYESVRRAVVGIQLPNPSSVVKNLPSLVL